MFAPFRRSSLKISLDLRSRAISGIKARSSLPTTLSIPLPLSDRTECVHPLWPRWSQALSPKPLIKCLVFTDKTSGRSEVDTPPPHLCPHSSSSPPSSQDPSSLTARVWGRKWRNELGQVCQQSMSALHRGGCLLTWHFGFQKVEVCQRLPDLDTVPQQRHWGNSVAGSRGGLQGCPVCHSPCGKASY